MKKFLSSILIFILIFNLVNPMDVTYAKNSNLSDIKGHWGEPYINRLVDINAISGYPDGTFKPNGTITRASFITVLSKALKLTPHESNYFLDLEDHWSQKYVSSVVDAGILNVDDYASASLNVLEGYELKPNNNITREEMAQIITRALGEEYAALKISKSDFTDNSLIDSKLVGYVATASSNGIITGYPGGKFKPTSYATRAEACVMITRLLDKLSRKPELSVVDSEDIYRVYSKAVVMIKGKDEDGKEYDLGSGFVIDKSGKVVTNYHVIVGMKSLEVTFVDGTTKRVVSVHNYDRYYDVAVLNLEKGSYDTVPIGNSRRLSIGEKIFTLGYPLVMNLSISDGLVSSKINDEKGRNYIQISAPISSGSSGGALVDKYGRVIGITSATFVLGQNMNIAIPICDIMNIITSKNIERSVESATKYDVSFTGSSVGGEVKSFDIFATNDLDMKEVSYDDTFKISNYDYLGFSVELNHKPDTKDNLFFGELVIRDDYGYYITSEYFIQRINKGNKTNISNTFIFSDLEGLGQGLYRVELYLNDELVMEEDTFILTSDVGLDTFNHVSTTIECFDYDTYKLSNKETVNKKNTFRENNTTAVGFKVNATFSKPAEDYLSILYEIKIQGDNGYTEYFNVTGILFYEESDLWFITGYGNSAGYFEAGNYTVSILYNGQTLDTTEFKVVEGTDLIINQQELEISKFIDVNDNEVEIPSILGLYNIVIPVKLGNIQKNSRIDLKLIIRSSNNEIVPTEFNEEYFYVTPDDSNSTYELDYYAPIYPDLIKGYVNGEDLFIDVYIDDKLIDTIQYEPVIPDDLEL